MRYRNYKQYPGRAVVVILQRVVLVGACTLGLIALPQALAQSKPVGVAKSRLCSQDNAFEIIKQQVDLTRTLSNTVRRITVLVRAGDLLWPYEPDKSRAVFTEAFELATESEKENEQKDPRSDVLRMQTPDQRYVVIRAIAKRDSAWAKELTGQMLKLDTHPGGATPTRDEFKDVLTAQRLLESAHQLISTDINVAFDLARASLNYPASSRLTRFIYKLAEINQQQADQFYAQALAAYADKPMRELLYLQAYPFGFRESLETPSFASYVVPTSFVANQSLQRRFVEIMLRRAQQVLEVPLDEGDTYRDPSGTLTPGAAHLLQSLIRLEPLVRASMPDLLAPLTQAREKILVSLSLETQKLFLQPGREISSSNEAGETTFEEQIETAEKTPNVNKRDDLIAMTVLSEISDKQSLSAVVDVIGKISESSLRAALLELVYFRRATTALKDRQFEEAEKLASRINGQEQRAYLHTEVAKGLLNRNETQTHARELLDEAITEANRAGTTIFAARTLLTVSTLYSRMDLGRSISVLADAINCINHIDDPDFSVGDQSLVKTVQRRSNPGGFIFRFYMPGLDPERAFREMAKIDFDNSLSQSSALTDKLQRAMSALALAEVCLQQAQQQLKEKPKKSIRP